jgi:hypothetical protein
MNPLGVVVAKVLYQHVCCLGARPELGPVHEFDLHRAVG